MWNTNVDRATRWSSGSAVLSPTVLGGVMIPHLINRFLRDAIRLWRRPRVLTKDDLCIASSHSIPLCFALPTLSPIMRLLHEDPFRFFSWVSWSDGLEPQQAKQE